MESEAEPPRPLYELQREAAALDVKLKQLELKQKQEEADQKSGRIYRYIRNPAIMAAVVAAGIPALVAIAAGVSSWIFGIHQKNAEAVRYEQETKKDILFSSINPSDPHTIATKLKLFLDTKLIDDQNVRAAEQDLEKQGSRNALLNILRASVYEPLEFSQSTSANPYSETLRPIDFQDFNYFIRVGYPRELVFRLFVDYVSIRSALGTLPGRKKLVIFNDPSDKKQCEMLSGKIDQTDASDIDGPDQSDTNKPDSDDAEQPDEGGRSSSFSWKFCFGDFIKFMLLSGLTAEIRLVSAGPGSPESLTEGRFCFDADLANRAMDEYDEVARSHRLPLLPKGIRTARYHPSCGETVGPDSWPTSFPAGLPSASAATAPSAPASSVPVRPAGSIKPRPGVQNLTVYVSSATGFPMWDINLLGRMVFEVGTRSTYSVYSYLGQIFRTPDTAANSLIGPPEEGGDEHMLDIRKGDSGGCFVSASFQGPNFYCVPSKGSDNTKRVFSLLSQLPQ